MSDYEYDDDFDNDRNSGSGLRKQLERALAKAKKAEDEAAAARSELAQSKATAELTAKGYPAAVARLAIKDGVDIANKEALENWLSENESVFAKPAAEQQNNENEQVPNPSDEVSQEIESAYRNVGNIHAAAAPAQVNAMQAALSALPEDATKEQVRAALAGL